MFFFFFFQAEDGIRDDLVTGVQTCALPICRRGGRVDGRHHVGLRDRQARRVEEAIRSEERRGGKEGRSRWAPYHSKKQKKKKARWNSRSCAEARTLEPQRHKSAS